MQAKCPNCDTVFRLTDEQLSIAKGKVRCGVCLLVFTATNDDTSADALPEEPAIDEAASEEDVAIEITASDDLQENIKPAFTTTGAETDESHDLFTEEPESSDIFPEGYRALDEQKRSSGLATFGWSLAILSLILTLVLEYAWFNKDKLAYNTELAPWLNRFCKIANCTIAPIHKPELIEMVNRNVYSHPNISKALMVTATIKNNAPYAQAYPDVEVSFSNLRGELVVQRIFTPDEYMNMNRKNLRLLQPNTPVTFGLEIKDPGKQALTYEFAFL